ncbi:MAG: glycosyltransferase, partial [Clostridia bacterium]|nr:glycosyltransferase [Clostridia bacterium]
MTKQQKVLFEKTYGPVTRMPDVFWKASYAMGMKFKKLIQVSIVHFIRKDFNKLMDEYQPSAVLTVHPIFIGSIIDLLEERGEKIPFYAHQADLVDIADQWFDKRIDMTFAPSQEAYECSVRNGLDPARLTVVGFPVRSRFYEPLPPKAPKAEGEPLSIAIMSGSEGSGTIRTIARTLLKETDAKVAVVCGRNKRLRTRLQDALGKEYADRLTAHGFVERIQDVMNAADLLIMRASPNSVFEAVALNKPVVIFGQLAGQELHNPDMLMKHGLVTVCRNAEELPAFIKSLQANNGEALKKMAAAQKAYAPDDTAVKTAAILNKMIP